MKKSELKKLIKEEVKRKIISPPKLQWLSTNDYVIESDIIHHLKPNDRLLVKYEGSNKYWFLDDESLKDDGKYSFYYNEDRSNRNKKVELFMIIPL
jgi:hypothetical protein